MTDADTKPAQPESPAARLARSGFGFGLLLLIPAVITWIAFLLSPVSPFPLYAQLRTVIIVGFGLLVLALLGLCALLLRLPLEQIERRAAPLVNLLRRPLIAFGLTGLLLELNALAFTLLGNVAPDFTNPGKFLLVCWSLTLFGILLTVNLDRVQQGLHRTGGLWMATGLTVALMILLVGLLWINQTLAQVTGLERRLSGSLDQRPLTFLDDGASPSPAQFWAEHNQMQVRWLPYSYWTVQPFTGDFITVDTNGLRQTPTSAAPNPAVPTIGVFGGSTVWGEGARDAYTIPSHLARLLDENGTPQHVINYGQTGYVSAQDMILFQMQLIQGNAPDLAVFYQGFNDILSAYNQNQTGIPYEEDNRVSDAEAGRLLRQGQPVLRPPDGRTASGAWGLVSADAATADAVLQRWLGTVEMIRALGDAYGVETLFVWQPALPYKSPRTPAEQTILDQIDGAPATADLFALYDEIDGLLREKLEESPQSDILMLSDLFAGDARPLFHDLVHITEAGNLTVAEALLPHVLAALEQRDE